MNLFAARRSVVEARSGRECHRADGSQPIAPVDAQRLAHGRVAAGGRFVNAVVRRGVVFRNPGEETVPIYLPLGILSTLRKPS